MRVLVFLLLATVAFGLCGCEAQKSKFAGRWISKETLVKNNAFTGSKADAFERQLVLDSNGNGQLLVNQNGEPAFSVSGKWSIEGDIFHLDYEGTKTIYMRILRVTNERLVLRNEEGKERIFDRLQ
jgi:hypothetical protein